MNKFTKSTVLAGMLGASTIALAMAMSTSAFAQTTTSDIRGTVTTEAGAPIANATVAVVNTATGYARTVTTNAQGQFSARNLNISGLYDLSVTGDGYQGERVEGVALTLGKTASFNFDLSAVAAPADEIIVVGQRTVLANVATGPSAVFTLSDLQNMPTVNRDIKDIIRMDPRVYIDDSFNDAIQCAGANPRFNSLTVDGVRMNDNFGLNSNGYPTERIPFSFDAIEQVAVELAPMDVEYGGFTACNINAVTKSGKNELYGGVFFDYTTKGLRGDKPEGFGEKRYGGNVGFPIIKDKLFAFVAYEKLEGSNLFTGSLENSNVSQANYDEIINIATSQYGYVSGGLPDTADNADEKLLVKLDWNINDMHRAAFTYNYNDGFNISQSDAGSTRLADGNHFYERGAKLKSYSGVLYSDWNQNLSTEFGVSFLDLDNRQLSVAGLDFGEVQIRNVGGGASTRTNTTVYLGADDSRHANKLNYTLTTFKAKADYRMDNHLFTIGVENESFDVFNLFVQEARGETVFNSIADFRNGDFSDYRYENAAGSNNVNDAAAQFQFSQRAFYVQDVWEVDENLTLTYGLRYDINYSDDTPTFNQNFFDQHGIRNDSNLDGKDLWQPRFGFDYNVDGNIEIHGGAGLFSGGNPNVWISNNYSNNGVTQFEYRVRGGNLSGFTYPNGGSPFFDIPQEGLDAVANAAGRGPVNAIDPDFELPSEWKFSLGTSFELDGGAFFGDGYKVGLDVLYSKTNEAALVRNLELSQTGTAPDGRPIYFGFPFNDFLLTNANDKGDSLVLSAIVSKEHDFGLNWNLGYAFTDANDVNPMTSSVAFSNDKNIALSDPLNPGLATSNYEIPHRFTFSANYKYDFIEDLTTTFSMFASYASGRPFSYVFNGNREFEGPAYTSRRQLFYVPTGPSDPLVDLSGLTDQAAFFAFLDRSGLNEFAGEIAPRNAFHDKWYTKVDLKIKQEFPGFRKGDKASAFIVLDNALNFIDSDWGVLRQHSFPNTAQVVDVDIVGGQFVYSGENSTADEGSIRSNPSTWEVRFGFNYDF